MRLSWMHPAGRISSQTHLAGRISDTHIYATQLRIDSSVDKISNLDHKSTFQFFESHQQQYGSLPVLQGWLSKKSPSSGFWQRRWVIVKNTHMLWAKKQMEITKFCLFYMDIYFILCVIMSLMCFSSDASNQMHLCQMLPCSTLVNLFYQYQSAFSHMRAVQSD